MNHSVPWMVRLQTRIRYYWVKTWNWYWVAFSFLESQALLVGMALRHRMALTPTPHWWSILLADSPPPISNDRDSPHASRLQFCSWVSQLESLSTLHSPSPHSFGLQFYPQGELLSGIVVGTAISSWFWTMILIHVLWYPQDFISCSNILCSSIPHCLVITDHLSCVNSSAALSMACPYLQ